MGTSIVWEVRMAFSMFNRCNNVLFSYVFNFVFRHIFIFLFKRGLCLCWFHDCLVLFNFSYVSFSFLFLSLFLKLWIMREMLIQSRWLDHHCKRGSICLKRYMCCVPD